jgi:hypothetical protein
MGYVLDIGCLRKEALIAPLRRVIDEIAVSNPKRISVQICQRPNYDNLQELEFGCAADFDAHFIVSNFADDVLMQVDGSSISPDAATIVISAPYHDEVGGDLWTIVADHSERWEEIVLDIIATMDDVVYVVLRTGDTAVSREIDIFQTRALPLTDYRYISGRLRQDRISRAAAENTKLGDLTP